MTIAPKVVGAHPEVVVARNHFRTSRYRNPTEMLGALGFHDPIGTGAAVRRDRDHRP